MLRSPEKSIEFNKPEIGRERRIMSRFANLLIERLSLEYSIIKVASGIKSFTEKFFSNPQTSITGTINRAENDSLNEQYEQYELQLKDLSEKIKILESQEPVDQVALTEVYEKYVEIFAISTEVTKQYVRQMNKWLEESDKRQAAIEKSIKSVGKSNNQ